MRPRVVTDDFEDAIRVGVAAAMESSLLRDREHEEAGRSVKSLGSAAFLLLHEQELRALGEILAADATPVLDPLRSHFVEGFKNAYEIKTKGQG